MASRLSRVVAAMTMIPLLFFRLCCPGSGEEEEKETGFDLRVISVVQTQKRPGRVFIYHTHTFEAYEPDPKNRYEPTERWRTADERFNMVRVGKELSDRLREAGIEVTHDTTAYELPRLSTAYSRSLKAMEEAAKEGYDLYLDLHRDAYAKGNGPNTVDAAGAAAARMLILIGKGTGSSLEEKPDWEANRQAAQAISDSLNGQAENLCRGISLKSGRYNQQAATPSMLIEVGNNKNTLPEALAAMEPLARAICDFLDGTDRPAP